MTTWLTIEEAAKHLKIGKSTLYQTARDGKVPTQKLGSPWRFDFEDLDQWMKGGMIPKIASTEDIERKRG